ncbi:hypothetical protein CDD83_4024 [Cordyceps sp. RAO-2017]|nr:hypothetical protein CDD83_4024 [Cordyceps sp. RAO-2017]
MAGRSETSLFPSSLSFVGSSSPESVAAKPSHLKSPTEARRVFPRSSDITAACPHREAPAEFLREGTSFR